MVDRKRNPDQHNHELKSKQDLYTNGLSASWDDDGPPTDVQSDAPVDMQQESEKSFRERLHFYREGITALGGATGTAIWATGHNWPGAGLVILSLLVSYLCYLAQRQRNAKNFKKSKDPPSEPRIE